MDAAQKKMKAEGIKVPWFITRGNHDTLVQGNVPASEALSVSGIPLPLSRIATGCAKPWPNDGVDPETFKGLPGDKVFDQLTKPENLAGVIGAMRDGAAVPPDPDRRYVSKTEFKKYVGSGDNRHGFGYVSKKQLKASNKQATYYAFTRGKFRIIMLDTNAEGGGSEGNIDNPQYKWLAKQLDKYSTAEVVKGKIRRDSGKKNKLIIISSHHTLETMANPTPDEAAGKCDPKVPGTDCDPRNSRPLHFGLKGKKNLKQLLLRYPNVVAYVNGHTHHNQVTPYRQPKSSKYKGGFWEINTASHVDWPQQSRTIEFFDNKDGSLSIFGTILDTAASVETPVPGTDAMTMTDGQLAALSRQISANDPQYVEVTDGGGSGDARDRNVELVVKDPRPLWRSK
jgi:metallophosphoesterase (TIGR03767 family)